MVLALTYAWGFSLQQAPLQSGRVSPFPSNLSVVTPESDISPHFQSWVVMCTRVAPYFPQALARLMDVPPTAAHDMGSDKKQGSRECRCTSIVQSALLLWLQASIAQRCEPLLPTLFRIYCVWYAIAAPRSCLQLG